MINSLWFCRNVQERCILLALHLNLQHCRERKLGLHQARQGNYASYSLNYDALPSVVLLQGLLFRMPCHQWHWDELVISFLIPCHHDEM
jgi:hypothetical protein